MVGGYGTQDGAATMFALDGVDFVVEWPASGEGSEGLFVQGVDDGLGVLLGVLRFLSGIHT